MKDPLISIIVPIFEVENFLVESIESIIHQSYSNIEIILVDDGSSDLSSRIANEYTKYDDRIIMISKKNSGVSEARNTGIKLNKGNYIFFVDPDDYIDNETLKFMYNSIKNNDSQISLCGINFVEENNNEILGTVCDNAKTISGNDAIENTYSDKNICYSVIWNKLYKKEIFNNILFLPNKKHEDEYIVHYLYNLCSKISIVDTAYYNYRMRHSSYLASKKKDIRYLEKTFALADRYYFIKNNLYDGKILKKAANFFASSYAYSRFAISAKDERDEEKMEEAKMVANKICSEVKDIRVFIKIKLPIIYIYLKKLFNR